MDYLQLKWKARGTSQLEDRQVSFKSSVSEVKFGESWLSCEGWAGTQTAYTLSIPRNQQREESGIQVWNPEEGGSWN